MVVAGLYDGNIAVYNLQKNTGQMFYNFIVMCLQASNLSISVDRFTA